MFASKESFGYFVRSSWSAFCNQGGGGGPTQIMSGGNYASTCKLSSGTGTTTVFTTHTVTSCGLPLTCPNSGYNIIGGGQTQSGQQVITTTASNGQTITNTQIPTGTPGYVSRLRDAAPIYRSSDSGPISTMPQPPQQPPVSVAGPSTTAARDNTTVGENDSVALSLFLSVCDAALDEASLSYFPTLLMLTCLAESPYRLACVRSYIRTVAP